MRFAGKTAFGTGSDSGVYKCIPLAGIALSAAAKLRRRGRAENDAFKKGMLEEMLDGELATIDGVAGMVLIFSAFPGHEMTGQPLIASHSWFIQ